MFMIFKSKDIKNIIALLESIKSEKDNLYRGIALGFAAKTLQLVTKAVGKESEQYRLMSTLLYDQTSAHLERKIYPVDSFIVARVKMDDSYNSIIDSCIQSVETFGLYKVSTEKKNVFGDLDNSMLWAIISAIAIGSFYLGIIYSNYKIDKLLNPTEEHNADQKKDQSKKHNTKDTTIKY